MGRGYVVRGKEGWEGRREGRGVNGKRAGIKGGEEWE